MLDEISPSIKGRTSCVCPGVVYVRALRQCVCALGVHVCTDVSVRTWACACVGVPCAGACVEHTVRTALCGPGSVSRSLAGPETPTQAGCSSTLSSPAFLLLCREGHPSRMKKRGGGSLQPGFSHRRVPCELPRPLEGNPLFEGSTVWSPCWPHFPMTSPLPVS